MQALITRQTLIFEFTCESNTFRRIGCNAPGFPIIRFTRAVEMDKIFSGMKNLPGLTQLKSSMPQATACRGGHHEYEGNTGASEEIIIFPSRKSWGQAFNLARSRFPAGKRWMYRLTAKVIAERLNGSPALRQHCRGRCKDRADIVPENTNRATS